MAKISKYQMSLEDLNNLSLANQTKVLNEFYRVTQQQIHRAKQSGLDTSRFVGLEDINISDRPTLRKAEKAISNLMKTQHMSREIAEARVSSDLLKGYKRLLDIVGVEGVTKTHAKELDKQKADLEKALGIDSITWDEYYAFTGSTRYASKIASAWYNIWKYGNEAGLYGNNVKEFMTENAYGSTVKDMNKALREINDYIDETGFETKGKRIRSAKNKAIGMGASELRKTASWSKTFEPSYHTKTGARK